jgi:hypothetical protein
MNRTPFVASILAAAAIALGSAGAWAHEPVPAADEQCGAQGEQTSDQNDDLACGAGEKGQSGDQGETKAGQAGTDEQGETKTGQNGTDEQGATESMQSGDQGANQSGEHEGEN